MTTQTNYADTRPVFLANDKIVYFANSKREAHTLFVSDNQANALSEEWPEGWYVYNEGEYSEYRISLDENGEEASNLTQLYQDNRWLTAVSFPPAEFHKAFSGKLFYRNF